MKSKTKSKIYEFGYALWISIWSLPMTLLGVVVFFLGGERVLRAIPLDLSVAYLAEANVALRWLLSRLSVIAIVIGPFIFVRTEKDAERPYLLRHELEHVRQTRRLGAFFLPAYFGASFWILLRTHSWEKAYFQNPFEVAARAAESAPAGHDEDT